jgi:NHL repeat
MILGFGLGGRLTGLGGAGRLAVATAAVTAAAMVPAAAAATGGHPHGAPAAGRAVPPGVIMTIAGGVGGPAKATSVALRAACGVGFGAGNLFISDGGSVRKVSPVTDALTTPAGTGVDRPFGGDGGPAAQVNLAGTCGTALDHSGNLLIADYGNSRIRAVPARSGTFYGQQMTKGDIYTIAGGGTSGLGDGGPATSAALDRPGGVAVDAAGNLVIADLYNGRIRLVAARTGTFYGQQMTKGDIYTIAGGGTGDLSDGGPATSVAIGSPLKVTLDATGNLLIADAYDHLIAMVAVRTGTFYGQQMTEGDIYIVAGTGAPGFSGDGGPASSAELDYPFGVAVDPAGNLLIADLLNNRIRAVAASTGTFYSVPMTEGDIYTIAGDGTGGFRGDGGPAISARFNQPADVAVDPAGNLVIADGGNHRVRMVAAGAGTLYGVPMARGDVYTIAGNGTAGFYGFGRPATSAELNNPYGVAVDPAGNLLIADTRNNRVRVVAASAGTFYGRAMGAGKIYTAAGRPGGAFPGDGGPGTSAALRGPTGVAADLAGNLVIPDTGNNRVRVVAEHTGTFYGKAMTAGHIYTIAGGGTAGLGDGGPATSAELRSPRGVAVDAAGNVLIAESQHRIRAVAARTGTFYGQQMTKGDIYTIAGNGTWGFSGDGGPATSAKLSLPASVAMGAAGSVLIADTQNKRVRAVAARTGSFYGQQMTAGHIYTVAGNGTWGFSGDGGPATSAELRNPRGVAADLAGNLLIADTENNRIRVVAASTGTFYGQAMTAGNIYPLAGIGQWGFSGDGGPATGAELYYPFGVAVDAAGNVLIADTESNRIRLVGG